MRRLTPSLAALLLSLAAAAVAASPVAAPPEAAPSRSDLASIAEPELRIELIEQAPEVTLYVSENARLEFGDGQAIVVPAESHLTFTLTASTPPERRYSVGVQTFTHGDRDKAEAKLAVWRDKGYTARLVPVGRLFRTRAGGVLVDTRRFWLILGSGTSEESAKTLERRLQKQGHGTWIHMETAAPASGTLEVHKRGKALPASGPTPARLTSSAPIEVEDVAFGIGFWGRGHREHRRFPGLLEVDATAGGKLTVLNRVGLEEYIRGVLPVEISIKAPLEAMKAQAVAARTEALAKLNIQHYGEPFDLCASQHCQEYGGLTRATARTDAAVRATRGIALMSEGAFVDAVYSASCGGHTEDNDKVWTSNPDPTLRGKLDAPAGAVPFTSPITARNVDRWLRDRPQTYCGDPRIGALDKFRWTVRLSAKELDRRVNHWYRVGRVKEIRLGERGVSGRLRRVDIIGDADRVTVRKELNIRRVFGGLKSALFVIDVRRDSAGMPTQFTFVGGGWGHGVGMCQNGASGMALEGYNYPAILAHYFSHSYLQRVYE